MKYFQEVTEWADNVPNHIYYLKDDKSFMVGYIKAGTKSLFKFKKPIQIDIRGRKFVEVKGKTESDEVYFAKPEQKIVAKETIEVEGSKGKKYILEKLGGRYVCSCPGYQFRRSCKHSEAYNKN